MLVILKGLGIKGEGHFLFGAMMRRREAKRRIHQ